VEAPGSSAPILDLDSDAAPRRERVTQRLYYTNAYLTEFEAAPVEVSEEGRRVYLDSTAFYPTSGGQPHDLGVIDGIPVRDVVDEGDRIAHVLERGFTSQHRVRGAVDWARRFDHMQQHTGQHLLSAVFAELFDAPTVSVHFGDEYATMDLGTQSLSLDQLATAEERANQILFENRPVMVSFEDSDAAAGLRKASDRTGVLRVVSIQDLDRSACGGTHVAATGEIGVILVRGTERVRDSMRVQFLCGARAVRRARSDYRSAAQIAAALSCGIDEVPDLAGKQQARLKDSEQRLRRLERELAELRAQSLYASSEPTSNGMRLVFVPSDEGLDATRALAQALARLPKVLAVGAVDDPPTLLIATSADSGLDASKLLRDAIVPHSGRGGGSPRMAQGSLPSIDAVRSAAKAVTAGG
jgi:alanyl-tRNA synthetase